MSHGKIYESLTMVECRRMQKGNEVKKRHSSNSDIDMIARDWTRMYVKMVILKNGFGCQVPLSSSSSIATIEMRNGLIYRDVI